MSDISEIIRLVESQGADLKTWREKQDAKFTELEQGVEDLLKKANRPTVPLYGATARHQRGRGASSFGGRSAIDRLVPHAQIIFPF